MAPFAPITQQQMEKVEREGLCSDTSLDIFLQWYSFGGMQRGLTLTELLSMPSWLRRDFKYILGQISSRRADRRRTQNPPGKKPRKGNTKGGR